MQYMNAVLVPHELVVSLGLNTMNYHYAPDNLIPTLVQQGLPSMGVFAGMEFEPNGTEPFYFPNGVRGISSLYLAEVSKELFNQGMLGKRPAMEHKHVNTAIRDFMDAYGDLELGRNLDRVLDHSYYDLAECTYYANKHRPNSTHIWMSPDLCLAIAGTMHPVIQMRIIDDLNRLTQMVNQAYGSNLHSPNLQQYLPGTDEATHRNQELAGIAEARAYGFIPMAHVKQLWVEQGKGKSFEEFDLVHPWRALYSALRETSDYMGWRVAKTESHVGKPHTSLFQVDVLKEVLPYIDFSSVDPN